MYVFLLVVSLLKAVWCVSHHFCRKMMLQGREEVRCHCIFSLELKSGPQRESTSYDSMIEMLQWWERHELYTSKCLMFTFQLHMRILTFLLPFKKCFNLTIDLLSQFCFRQQIISGFNFNCNCGLTDLSSSMKRKLVANYLDNRLIVFQAKMSNIKFCFSLSFLMNEASLGFGLLKGFEDVPLCSEDL